jgi:diguanylate cyclase (GGDEF)-like protein
MYPLLAAGLLNLSQGRGGSRWSGMTEAGIVLCTGSALMWVTLYDPFFRDRGGHWAGPACALVYPALDLLVLAAATRMIVVHGRLTGLPNRTQLEELLADPVGGALILVDLDGFKDVNERFGHPTGDDLLVSVAGRLGGTTSGDEVVARLGGDEFALLLPATALTLEITEGVLVRSGAHAAQALLHLSALRAEGVRVAIDDFGTGYSSLAYLRDLPIDVLKIDRSFMPADDTDVQQAVLVRAIVDLATGLGLTIAEGVEAGDQAVLLRALGCHRAQGYHFARPVPVESATEMLASAGNVQVHPVPADQHSDAGRGVSVK